MTLAIVDLHPEIGPMERLPFEIPVLHGHTLAGKPCTLLNVTYSTAKHTSPAAIFEEWITRAGWSMGRTLTLPISSSSSGPAFGVSGMREWLWQHWPGTENPFIRGGEGVLEVPLSAATMTLQREERKSHGQFESKEEFSAWARFDFDLPVSLSEFEERYSTPLHDLVLFAIHEETRVRSDDHSGAAARLEVVGRQGANPALERD